MVIFNSYFDITRGYFAVFFLFHQKDPLGNFPQKRAGLRQAMQLPRIEEEHLEVRKVGR